MRFLTNFSNFLSILFAFLERIPVKFMPMQIKDMVTLVSRTGRHLQRYDHKGFRQVVGCVPYRYVKLDQTCLSDGFGFVNEELQVLLISAQNSGGMLFPKGGWEADESMKDAALRETLEESGVVGDIEFKLGKWRYKSKRSSIMHEVYMFSMHVKKELDTWPEQDKRKRRWVSVSEAREICPNWWMKEALEELVRRQTQVKRRSQA